MQNRLDIPDLGQLINIKSWLPAGLPDCAKPSLPNTSIYMAIVYFENRKFHCLRDFMIGSHIYLTSRPAMANAISSQLVALSYHPRKLCAMFIGSINLFSGSLYRFLVAHGIIIIHV